MLNSNTLLCPDNQSEGPGLSSPRSQQPLYTGAQKLHKTNASAGPAYPRMPAVPDCSYKHVQAVRQVLKLERPAEGPCAQHGRLHNDFSSSEPLLYQNSQKKVGVVTRPPCSCVPRCKDSADDGIAVQTAPRSAASRLGFLGWTGRSLSHIDFTGSPNSRLCCGKYLLKILFKSKKLVPLSRVKPHVQSI